MRWGWWVWVLVLMFAPPAWAQDSHYWTRQFGNRAWLLGGAFVGNPGDISAVYYNPGALALLTSPELELTGSVYEYTRVSVENAQGAGNDLADTGLDAVPSLIAGSLRFDFLGKSKLAYSVLTRQGFSFAMESREQVSGTDLGGVAGMDQLAADVRLDQSVNEYWLGLTWAWPFGKHLGVGLSPFLAARDQQTRFEVLAQGSGGGGRALLSTLERDFELQHLRLLAKLGLTYQRGAWAAGLTVTSPSLGLWGRGSVGLQRATVSQGLGSPGFPTPVFDSQDDVSGTFRSGWAVALGASGTLGSTTLYATVEGFSRVPAFTLLDAAPVTPRDSSEVLDEDVHLGLAPVVNVAVGVEQRLGPRLRAYLSAHTDFSALAPTSGTNALLSDWDIYHVSSGAHFTAGRSRFTLGGNLSWGGQVTQRLADTLAEAGLQPPRVEQRVRFLQVTAVIGVSFSLADKRETHGEAEAHDDDDAGP